jgi:hypothetical protein
MRTRLRLASWLAVLSLLLLLTGVGYGLVTVSRHSNPDCGKQSNGLFISPRPDPCARTEADWRLASALAVPGLAGLVAAGALGLTGTTRRGGP